MIALYFPGRTRAQIKAKWKRENKLDEARITEAMMSKKPRGELFPVLRCVVGSRFRHTDLAKITELSGVELDGPCPDDPMEPFYFDRPNHAKKASQTPHLEKTPEQLFAPAESSDDEAAPAAPLAGEEAAEDLPDGVTEEVLDAEETA